MDIEAEARLADIKVLRASATKRKPTATSNHTDTADSSPSLPEEVDVQYPATAEDGEGAVEHPDANPAWSRTGQAPSRASLTTKEELQKFVQGNRTATNLLDDQIYRMRVQGLGASDIAQRLGSKVSTKFVEDRLADLLSRRNQLTTGEYRALQVGRLEAVLNMMWGWAESGSVNHIELILKAIERLNKIFELEKETSRIEVEIISDGQAQTMKMVFDLFLQEFTRSLSPHLPQELIRDLFAQSAAKVTQEAAAIIDAPQTRMRAIS